MKSRRTFNNNYCDLLTAITQTKILAAYLISSDKKTEVAHYGSKAYLLLRLNQIPTGFFGQPFVKQFGLCYQTVVCLSCLSVTLEHCANGWMNQDKTWHGVGLGPGHTVLDGDSAPPPKRGTTPNFGAYLLWRNGWMD